MHPAIIVVIIISAAIALFFAVDIVYALCTVKNHFLRRPPKRKKPAPETALVRYRREGRARLAALPYEKKEIAVDELTLRARYYPAGSEKTVVAVHGYRGCGERDMAFIVPALVGRGYNVLLPDLRAHGESDGKVVGFGVTDRTDIAEWVKTLAEEYRPAAVWLYGVSMGASAVLMSSALDLPAEVKGIIADCGYTSIDAQISHLYATVAHIPPPLAMPWVRLFARRVAGYDPRAASAPDALRRTTLPVLFIHGRNDRFVPPRMTEENAAACAAPHEVLFTDGRHATSHFTDPEGYERRLFDFLSRTE